MPVHDAPVHEKVKITDSTPYGCSNHPRSHGYYVKTRLYDIDGTFSYILKYFRNAMSQKCRYDGREKDPRCSECKRESDKEYLEGYGL